MTPQVILCPTDFSGISDRARARAVQLARLWSAKLILLHVLEEVLAEDSAGEDSSEEMLIKARLRAEVADADIEVETRLARGDVADAIVGAARREAADLIVTGVSRPAALGDFVIGTTVERVVRHAATPVLVVKGRMLGDYEKIMVATDFSGGSALALETAGALFPAAAITLVHAYEVRFESIRGREEPASALLTDIAYEAEAFLQGVDLPTDLRDRLDVNVDYGDICTVARHHAQSTGTELAVVGTRGRAGAIAALLGSTARALLACLDCDVLLVGRTHREAHS